MRSLPLSLILIPFAIVMLSTGFLLAQTVGDVEESLTCDLNDLIFDQAEAHFALDSFAQDLEADPSAALAQLYETGELYQQLALDCGYIPENAGELFVGNDVDRIMTVLETIRGDPLNGQLLYNNEAEAADGSELGCIGCHEDDDSTGPMTAGTWTRWDEIHSLEPRFEGYDFERYTVESIVLPWDYTVEGYAENIMPNNFGDRLSYQDLADIVAYLSTQDQFLPEN